MTARKRYDFRRTRASDSMATNHEAGGSNLSGRAKPVRSRIRRAAKTVEPILARPGALHPQSPSSSEAYTSGRLPCKSEEEAWLRGHPEEAAAIAELLAPPGPA
jgi:hypothetical protein